MIRTARRMPGIAVERVPVRTSRVLPRMDVAAFVGFAASGPLQVPVRVDDYGHFRDVFGGPARLAWDADAGRHTRAQLGPAVRAYFAGGGRRAYVLRVAGDGAERSEHPVPGLLESAGGPPVPARLTARSRGSWSDSLVVGTALTSEPAAVTRIDTGPSRTILGLSAGLGARGDLLRVRAGSWTGYLPVSSRPADDAVEIDVGRSLWLEPDAAPAGQLGATGAIWSALRPGDTAERLTLELWVRDPAGRSWVLPDLGLAPGHPRYLGDLPIDEEYFAAREPLRGPAPGLWAAVAGPRFPLAARPGRPVFYPTRVTVTPETFLPAVTAGSSALERDGLATYGDALFLDRRLRDLGVDTILATADYLRWQSPSPRALSGVHAVLGLDEVTVVAVPDAVQRPWHAEPALPVPLPPPSAEPAEPPGCHRPPFADCARPDLGPAPELSATANPDGSVTVAWSATPGAGVRYRLQVTSDPRRWDGARDVHLGTGRSRTDHGDLATPRFYRVRAEQGTLRTAWSDGAAVGDTGAARHVVDRAADYGTDLLTTVHQGLMRMCAARGDLLAVLSVPEHFRTADAAAHAGRLRSLTDIRALGFGAVYHPWVGTTLDEPAAEVGWSPPDGVVTGVIARRALTRGAWVAPANEPLAGVVALRHREPGQLLPVLQAAQVNALRQMPGGFVCLAEDTLTGDEELRPINVRRLISLVRRLAAREGAQYVFEPNDPTLRRAVDRGFTDVLAFLFRLGAFAGRTPEEGYRVVVGDPPNTAQSLDLGRLVVELKFAPAQPLEFLLLRLVQTGEHGFTLEVS